LTTTLVEVTAAVSPVIVINPVLLSLGQGKKFSFNLNAVFSKFGF
jgi:hypothetical protein